MAVGIPSGFASYEAFRIILPGFFGAGFLFLDLEIFLPSVASSLFGHQAFSALFLLTGIILGLLLYDLDYPVRRRFYTSDAGGKAPSRFLYDWCTRNRSSQDHFKVSSETDAVNLYFVILNGYMESANRERAFYFGSLYRLLMDLRVILMVGSVSTLLIFLTYERYVLLIDGPLSAATYVVSQGPYVLVVVTIAAVLYLVFSRSGNKGERNLLGSYANQIVWLQTHEDVIRTLLAGKGGLIEKPASQPAPSNSPIPPVTTRSTDASPPPTQA